jgi:hypothetical protein
VSQTVPVGSLPATFAVSHAERAAIAARKKRVEAFTIARWQRRTGSTAAAAFVAGTPASAIARSVVIVKRWGVTAAQYVARRVRNELRTQRRRDSSNARRCSSQRQHTKRPACSYGARDRTSACAFGADEQTSSDVHVADGFS